MATSWSTKRRFIYGGTFISILVLLVGLVFWNIFYKAPTCSDGSKNGDETGVDCGGSCKNLCTSDTLNPVVLWSKIFNVSGDVYTAVAYIENPNLNSRNVKATYQFSVFDSDGKFITSKEGETSIPKGKKFAVFETGIIIKGSKPKTSDFKFTSLGAWEKDLAKDPELSIKYGTLTSTSTVPRITGTITNNSLTNIHLLELAVFVLDGNENVVAASNSFIDDLNKRSTQDFVFTWPKPINLGVEVCLSPLDISLALDRSGSMRSEGSNPPEPFSTVLSTAKDFISNLTIKDQVSVISFGTNSKLESSLSSKKESALNAVSNMSLGSTSEQTNIAGGLKDSFTELQSANVNPNAKKVIILLTDGIPTEPKDSTNKDYPAQSAKETASQIKSAGIDIFTIGLGKDTDGEFLKSISTDENHYYFAPSKETLSSVYKKISSSLCEKKPNVINVIYREIK